MMMMMATTTIQTGQQVSEPLQESTDYAVKDIEAYDLTCVVVPKSCFASGASRVAHIMDEDLRRAVEFCFAACVASNGLGSNSSSPTFVDSAGKRKLKVRVFAECLFESPISLSVPRMAGMEPRDMIWEGTPSLYGHSLPGAPCGGVNGRSRQQVEQTPNSTYDYMGSEKIEKLLEASWGKDEPCWSWQKLFHGNQSNGRLLVSLYDVLEDANCSGIRFWLVGQDPKLMFNDMMRSFVCRSALSIVGKAQGGDYLSGAPVLPPDDLEPIPARARVQAVEAGEEDEEDQDALREARSKEKVKEIYRDLFGKFYAAEQKLMEMSQASRFAPPFDPRAVRLIATHQRYYEQVVNVVVNKGSRGEAPHWNPANPAHPQSVDLCESNYNIKDVTDPGSPMSWLPWGIECGNIPAGKVCSVQTHIANYVSQMAPRAPREPRAPAPVPVPVPVIRPSPRVAAISPGSAGHYVVMGSGHLVGLIDTAEENADVIEENAESDLEDESGLCIPLGQAVAPPQVSYPFTDDRMGDDEEDEEEERECFLFSIPLSVAPIEIDTASSPLALRNQDLKWTARSPFECLMHFAYRKCVEAEQSQSVETQTLSRWSSAYAQRGQAHGFSRQDEGEAHTGVEAHMKRFVDKGEMQCQAASDTMHVTPMDALERLRVENGRWRHLMTYLCKKEEFQPYVMLMHTSFLEHAVGRFAIAISPNSDVSSSVHSIAAYVRNNERTLIKPRVTALPGLGLRNSSHATMITKLRSLFKMSSTMRQAMKLLLAVYNVYSDPVTDYEIRGSGQKLSVCMMAAPGAGKSFVGEVLRWLLIPGSELPAASFSEQSLSNHGGMRNLYVFMDEACDSLTSKPGKGCSGPSSSDWKMLLSAGESSRTKTVGDARSERRRTETFLYRHSVAFIVCANEKIGNPAVDDRVETIVPPTVSSSYLPVDHQPSEMDDTTKMLKGVFIEEQRSKHALMALANLMIGCGVILPPELGMDKEMYSDAIRYMCQIDPGLGKKNRNATRASILHMQRAIADTVDILSSEASPEVFFNPERPNAPPSVRPFSLLRFAAFMGPNLYSRTETAEYSVADVVDQTYNKDLHELANMLAQELGNFSYSPPKEELERIRAAGPEEKKRRVATLFPPDWKSDPTNYLNMFTPESVSVANQKGVVRPGCRYRQSVLETDVVVQDTAEFVRVDTREGIKLIDPNWVRLQEHSFDEVVQYAVKNFRGVPIDESVAKYMLGKMRNLKLTYHPYNSVLDADSLPGNGRVGSFYARGIKEAGIKFDEGASDCVRQQNITVTEYAMRVVEVQVGKGKKQQRVDINTAYLELTPSSVLSDVLDAAAFDNTPPHFVISPTSPLQYPELSQLFYVSPVDRKRSVTVTDGVNERELALMGYRSQGEQPSAQSMTEEREVFYARKHWAKFPHVPEEEKWRYLSSQVDKTIRETQANHPYFEEHRRMTAPSAEDRERAQVLAQEIEELGQLASNPKECESAKEWALAVKTFQEKAMELDLIQAGYPVPQIRAKRAARLRQLEIDAQNALLDQSKHPYYSRILGEDPQRSTEPSVSRDRFGYSFLMAMDRNSLAPSSEEHAKQFNSYIGDNRQIWVNDIAPNIPSVVQQRQLEAIREEEKTRTPQAVAAREQNIFIDLTDDEIVERAPFVSNFLARQASTELVPEAAYTVPPGAHRGQRSRPSSSSSVFSLLHQRRSPEPLRQSAPSRSSPAPRPRNDPVFEEEDFSDEDEEYRGLSRSSSSLDRGPPAEKRPRYS